MSTALVSQFADLDLYQNRRNCMVQRSLSFDVRKPLSTQSSSVYRSRLSSAGSLSPLESGRYSPESPTSSHMFLPISSSPIMSNNTRQQQQQPDNMMMMLNNKNSMSNKLDRSMSEPNCNSTPQSPSSQRSANSSSGQQQQQQQQVNSSRYKTELCRPYEETRYCKYGDKCQFAHGYHELRSVARHPKYKTELCRTFHTIGICPYGPRCHFIHNEDERKMSQINHLKQQLALHPHTGPVQPPQQPQQLTASPPSHIQRPKALSFSMPRDCPLGSTGDSPPSSVSDANSPTMSPTFLGDDFLSTAATFHHHQQQQSNNTTANVLGPELAAALSSILSPLAVQTDASLAGLHSHMLHAVSLNNQRNNHHHQHAHQHQQQHQSEWRDFAPPSPPESLSGDSSASSCGSPLDVSRGLRLPIFSRLSSD